MQADWAISSFVSTMAKYRGIVEYYPDRIKIILGNAIDPQDIEYLTDGPIWEQAYRFFNCSPKIHLWASDSNIVIVFEKGEVKDGKEAKEEKGEDDNQLDGDLKKEIAKGDDKGYEYKVDKENDFVVARHKGGTCQISMPLSKLKKLYELLPEQFTPRDLMEKGKEIGVNIHYSQALALIRVFSHVEFNAEITRVGRQVIGIKDVQGYLRDENRNKMRLEREVIGDSWGEA